MLRSCQGVARDLSGNFSGVAWELRRSCSELHCLGLLRVLQDFLWSSLNTWLGSQVSRALFLQDIKLFFQYILYQAFTNLICPTQKFNISTDHARERFLIPNPKYGYFSSKGNNRNKREETLLRENFISMAGEGISKLKIECKL